MRLIGLIIIMTCSTSTLYAQTIKDVSWIAGNWASNQNGSTISESWTVNEDSTSLSGKSEFETNEIVQFSEELAIISKDGSLRYIAILPSKTAIFMLEELKNDTVSFSDPENDFPSRISYIRTATGLDIILEGSANSNAPTEVLSFRKQ